MTRQCYVDHGKKIVVFWAPKSGCTSIVDIFAEGVLEGRWELKGKAYSRKDLVYFGYHHNYRQAYQLLRSGEGYKSIAVLRDPYDRAVSGYIEKFVRHSSGRPILTCDDMEPFARKTYMNICEHHGLGVADGITFRQFVDYICDCVSKRMESLDHHFNSQVPHFYREVGFSYDYLYRLSSFPDFVEKLSELSGNDIDVVHKRTNKAVIDQDQSGEDYSGATNFNLAAIDGGINRRQFNDVGCMDRMTKDFSDDYFYFDKGC
ncbi:sulfotransferase family protein [Marinimicrobium koreense]|uniref:Sulfotransferase family protein n=1 Tax=Marinimicrobium koreense TaxID=306545 RepID=A0A3N1P5E7_9GAMM|nr:sulfotransferase family 2 domain-containing protein [Marinimicrobium koreense]ROQ20046.1 sulfotransferase family protein [Marinimicrobium koreense]